MPLPVGVTTRQNLIDLESSLEMFKPMKNEEVQREKQSYYFCTRSLSTGNPFL